MSNNNVSLITGSLLNHFDGSTLTITPVEIPSNSNGNLAIVQCELRNKNTTVSDFGSATPHETGSNNPNDILTMARLKALQNVAGILDSTTETIDVDYFPINKHQKSLPESNHDKSSLQGGGSKIASRKQLDFINGLCKKQYENIEDVSMRVCGKCVSALTGSDANAIIADLK